MDKIDYSISLKDTNAAKGVAIIAMLIHHLFYLHPEYGVIVHQMGKIGKVCVAIFLFLSGYGLSITYSKCLKTNDLLRGGVKFISKRVLKFYMSYWFVFVITVSIGVLGYGRGLDIPYGSNTNLTLMFIKDFFGINGFDSYNITWWFNKLILTMYLCFPILYFLCRSKYIGLVTLVLSYRYPTYFSFILGMMVATNIDLINKILSYLKAHIILVLAVLAVASLCILRQKSSLPYASGQYLDGVLASFIVLLAVSVSRLGYGELKLLQYLGAHSMNIYMIHTFIYYYFHSEFIYGFKHPIFIFLALLMSSLTISILIEGVKKYVGFYRFQEYLIKTKKTHSNVNDSLQQALSNR